MHVSTVTLVARCCVNLLCSVLMVTGLQLNMAWLVQAALPIAPSNLTVTYVTNHFALVTWHYSAGVGFPVSRFEMTIRPIPRNSSKFRDVRIYSRISDLEPYLRTIKLEHLKPATVYLVYMTAVNDEGYSNKSNNVTFTTVSDSAVFRPGDACVVLIIIFMWIVAVVIFLQKWGSIRIVQPRELRYKFNPKNLDTIRVVKRAHDSVIYKGYSRQLSFTMEKREQKLERMNTLQTIEMEKEEEPIEKVGKKEKKKDIKEREKHLREKERCTKEREKCIKEREKRLREKDKMEEKGPTEVKVVMPDRGKPTKLALGDVTCHDTTKPFAT